MVSFQERIKQLRKRQDKKQEEIAASLHISPKTLSKYERGKAEPDLVMLKKIAKVYGVDVNYLLSVSAQESPEDDFLLVNGDIELLTNYHQLSKREQIAVRNLMKDLLKQNVAYPNENLDLLALVNESEKEIE